MVELTWHELMTEDLRAYEAAPGTPQQGNFDEHGLGDYIIDRTKPRSTRGTLTTTEINCMVTRW